MDKSASILIVDDYLLIRTAVRQVLTELGFINIFQAENGKTAQDLMRKQAIDIVIGDWSMPIMSGLELLGWMRKDSRYARTPYMMLTAESNPASVRSALQAGVSAYMIKPFTVHSFASKFMAMIGSPSAPPASPFQRAAAPAKPAAAPAPAPAPAASAPTPLTPPLDTGAHVIGLQQPLAERIKKSTVLIVDDVPTNIEILAGALKDEYAIKVAISGRKAIEIANSFQVDLILLDIMMPVMDGFETCRELKANPKTAGIPIIFLSAKDAVDDVVGGLRLGAVDYVSKPADPTILKARIATHLTLAAATADLQRQNALLVENAHLREDVERMTRHDLKSPLAVALHGSQALQDSELTDSQREHARMIEMAANNALEMINRTLDIYRMEKGEYQPALQGFDIKALLERVAQQTRLAFAPNEIDIRFAAPSDTICLGEPLLCYSMFSNAFKNAAEASPEGGVIKVDVSPGYGSLHVVIDNEGEVPLTMRGRFFEKYATADKEDGSGLGTYSIRLMAEVQGGGAEMDTGDGHTRLTITLPCV
ncbi:Chemotaxis protein CheY [Massilia sp. Bi118]|uniref:response regulator n=1 Tax=Massilia sp. Bi118 TaxID=2822346 RepID=UPI001D22DBF2|nr:response regulator [Massilia sp. Bi118]CAH0240050.1 Chemotaxis protein CheY [Massilia sp. Bi118]